MNLCRFSLTTIKLHLVAQVFASLLRGQKRLKFHGTVGGRVGEKNRVIKVESEGLAVHEFYGCSSCGRRFQVFLSEMWSLKSQNHFLTG